MPGVMHFNPRSRVGSDRPARPVRPWDLISIHAPAKGATRALCNVDWRALISIHAPAKGATVQSARTRPTCSNFNPRSRVGSDLIPGAVPAQVLAFQSTLPRRERRRGSRSRFQCAAYFNPRSREGSDKRRYSAYRLFMHFNPRSREGSDNTPKSGCLSLSDFNPRSREGSDAAAREQVRQQVHFNPRSREGSDLGNSAMRLSDKISIHAPAKGATHCQLFDYYHYQFQSTLPRRERRIGVRLKIMRVGFQSTLP